MRSLGATRPGGEAMEPLFELQDVTLRSRSGKQLLDSLSLSAQPGDFIAVIGPNGAGKTTLLRTILGLVSPTEGAAMLQGQAAEGLAPTTRAALVSWMPQRPVLASGITACDLVSAARFRFHESRRVAGAAADRFLQKVSANDLANRWVTTLSGGEQQRVSLAATLAQEAPLLLLDEPASHLDPAAQVSTYAQIGGLREAGLTIVCVTHDINLLRHANRSGQNPPIRVIGLCRGRRVCEFPYGDPTSADRLSELFSIRFGTAEVDRTQVLLPLGEPGLDGNP